MLRSRRDVLKNLAWGVAGGAAIVAGLGKAGLAGASRSQGSQARSTGSDNNSNKKRGGAPGVEANLVTSLTPGTKFAACTLVAVQPMDNGAIPVVMAGTNGARFNIDVMRFDADIHGVARAGSMAVYLSNLGDGSTATDEEHGLAAMALASELARREAAGEKVPTMKTISDRGARAEAPRLIS